MSQIQTVLCPVDFTPLSRAVLRRAVEICERFGARLVLLHNLGVAPPGILSVSWMWSEEHRREEQEREEAVPERLRELFAEIPPTIEYEAKVSRGPTDEVLLLLAGSLPADVIVMGSHGWSDADHRSLTETIVVKAPCPVVTVPAQDASGRRLFPGADDEVAEVVVPTDFTRRSRQALKYALRLAEELPLRLHLVHVYREQAGPGSETRQPEGARRRLERLAATLPDETAGILSVRPVDNELAGGIDSFAEETGSRFVVMASHWKGPFERMLHGTTTLEMLHGCSLPVWFVPSRLPRRKRRSRIDLS